MNHHADTVSWFFGQLARQFYDHQLEASGVQFDLYFDTKNVRRAAVGIQGLPKEKWRHTGAQFDSETLVECLFSSGWLGPVRMLSPHQAEFLALLNVGLDVGDEEQFNQITEEYLATFEYEDNTQWAVEQISTHSLAQRTFKSIELTRLFWKKRIAQWRADKLLETETLLIDFDKVLKSPTCQELRNAFDRYRPSFRRSNLADAIALTGLAVEIKRASVSKRLPLLFSPPLFRDVVQDAGMRDRFEYEAGGQKYSALCEADYFIFRSILYPAEKHVSDESLAELRNKLADLRARLEDLLSPSESESKMLLTLVAEREHGRFDPEQLSNYSFFDSVWLPVAAAAKLHMHGSLKEIVALMQSESVQQKIADKLGDLDKELLHNTEQYRNVRKLGNSLSPAVKKLETQIPAAMLNERPLDVLGLVRFSFPSSAQSDLKDVLQQVSRDPTHVKTTSALYRALKVARTAPDPSRLAVNAALLWIAELYDDLVQVVQPYRHKHFSLMAIFGSAAVEDNQLDVAASAADELERMLQEEQRGDVRGSISVALSYIYYHLALKNGFHESWHKTRLSSDYKNVPAHDLVEKSINHARAAAGNMELDASLHVYAVNLAVFYSVSLPVTDRNRLRQLTIQLLQYKSQPVWQYRYEDTLARYFFLAAMEAPTDEEFQRNFRLARHHSGAASEKAPFDPRIGRFEAYLEVIRPALEARIKPSPPPPPVTPDQL